MILDKHLECMSREELTNYQSELLVKLVNNVYQHCAVYAKKMDDAGVTPADIKGVQDITKLPFTTKQDLRDNYPFGMFTAAKKDIVRVHASSGTTGKLTTVGYTKNDIKNWAKLDARCLAMVGADENSVVHNSYGYGLFTGGLGMHYGIEELGAMAVPCSSGNTARQLMLLKDFEADTICCTPSYCIYLSEKLGEEVKLEDLKLKRAVLGAEPWSEEMRKEIEKRLHLKAYDIYGLSEIMGPGVAMECELQDGLHINEDHFYAEILDTKTLQPVPYGEYGELVITTLTKEGIPLIRYRTRDITCLRKEACKCGRTFVKMERIKGRSDDMLIIRGVNVFPSQIENVLMNVGSSIAPHYQIIVDRVNNTDTFEIQVEMSENFFSDEVKAIQQLERKITQNMESMLGISCDITLVSPNTISRSEGKAKIIIDKRQY
ncbi:MAG: phenylacetate--CoA ligase [Clostridia bacterium]